MAHKMTCDLSIETSEHIVAQHCNPYRPHTYSDIFEYYILSTAEERFGGGICQLHTTISGLKSRVHNSNEQLSPI